LVDHHASNTLARPPPWPAVCLRLSVWRKIRARSAPMATA
jgi:hypothetical protein